MEIKTQEDFSNWLYSANLCAIILAAGLGKRMNSDLPKVLHKILDEPMLVMLVKKVYELKPSKIIIIVGKYKSIISSTLKDYLSNDILNLIEFSIQKEPLGTGDAVKSCLNLLNDDMSNIILNGDSPLISYETLHEIYINNDLNNYDIQITSISTNNPTGSGRIIYDNNSYKIVEEKDCTNKQKKLKKINIGIYVAKTSILKKYIPMIKNNNVQSEYYLTDIINFIKDEKIGLFELDKKKQKRL